uniref:Uncharacterized protein n=1 Tax=Salmonella sp. TaxID=599 RepID=A0A482EVH5_SALSP|nr:hypothetical protein NNIBIDOC_00082 [Salmonella sp.]
MVGRSTDSGLHWRSSAVEHPSFQADVRVFLAERIPHYSSAVHIVFVFQFLLPIFRRCGFFSSLAAAGVELVEGALPFVPLFANVSILYFLSLFLPFCFCMMAVSLSMIFSMIDQMV